MEPVLGRFFNIPKMNKSKTELITLNDIAKDRLLQNKIYKIYFDDFNKFGYSKEICSG